jgi:hypothetical protein
MRRELTLRHTAVIVGFLLLLICLILVERTRGGDLGPFLATRLSPALPGMLLAWGFQEPVGARRLSRLRLGIYVLLPLFLGIIPAIAPVAGRLWFVTRSLPVVLVNGLTNALPLLALLFGMGLVFSFQPNTHTIDR